MAEPGAAPAQPGLMDIEVVYAERDRQWLLAVQLPAGASVADAIEASGITGQVPGLEVAAERVGIFGRKAGLSTELRNGDRVEIYRPLLIDPMSARRLKAESQKDLP